MKDYHINILFSDEDDCYIADIPDLPFCSAFGATPGEALKNLENAKRLWLEEATATGREVPPPSYRPLPYRAGFASAVGEGPQGKYS